MLTSSTGLHMHVHLCESTSTHTCAHMHTHTYIHTVYIRNIVMGRAKLPQTRPMPFSLFMSRRRSALTLLLELNRAWLPHCFKSNTKNLVGIDLSALLTRMTPERRITLSFLPSSSHNEILESTFH